MSKIKVIALTDFQAYDASGIFNVKKGDELTLIEGTANNLLKQELVEIPKKIPKKRVEDEING